MCRKSWFDFEEKHLKQIYSSYSNSELAYIFDRTINSVRRKASKLDVCHSVAKLEPGDRFGRLTVVGESYYVKSGRQRVMMTPVRCDCGTLKSVKSTHIRNSRLLSCGCLTRERAGNSLRQRVTTHGMSTATLYRRWGSRSGYFRTS